MSTRSTFSSPSSSSAGSSSASPITSAIDSPLHAALYSESNFTFPTASGSSSILSTTQHSPSTTQNQKFKDLLIFEERLKQNLNALRVRQQKYEAILGFNCCLITLFSYLILVYQVENSTLYFLCVACLISAISYMVIFFLSGQYAEKIATGQKYVPQCNRALRAFNLHFNRDNKGELNFYRKVPKKFQEGFEKYRKLYIEKKRERAKVKDEKEKGKEK